MNITLPSPDELKDFQITHYSEMMQRPRSFEHKIFLRKQIYNLKKQNDGNIKDNTGFHWRMYSHNDRWRLAAVPVLL